MSTTSTAVAWPDSLDEIFGGDQAVALAHVTPASGVVLTPLTNFGIRDRQGGRVTPLNSSIGMWKKLERIQQNPRVAVTYHTRKHGFSDREDSAECARASSTFRSSCSVASPGPPGD